MTTEEKRAIARRHRAERWHEKDAQCGICGTVARLVPLESAFVAMGICLRCATRRMQVQRKGMR